MTVRPKTIKLPEGNISSQLLDSGFEDDFLNLISKAKATRAKINRWIYVKLKGFCTGKETTKKTRGAYRTGEEICKNTSDKD